MTDLNDFAIARAATVRHRAVDRRRGLRHAGAATGLPRPADTRQQLDLFVALEHRFAAIARWSVLVAGLSGLWLT